MCIQTKCIKRLLGMFTSSTEAMDFRRFILKRAGRIACSSSRSYPGHSAATGRVTKFGQALTEEPDEGCPKRGARESSLGICQPPYESTQKSKSGPSGCWFGMSFTNSYCKKQPKVRCWNKGHLL